MSEEAKAVKGDARIPCLDGIRAVSILMVLLAHLNGTRHFPKLYLDRWLELGNFGVRVFFVISGYLITSLLMKEYEKTRTISLPQFYFRRTFRIFPAFYVLIGALFVADQLGAIHLRDGDVLHAATYTTNYHHERAWEMGHLWSLAVEEQFYLLWPAVFMLAGPRRSTLWAFLTVLAAPALRVASWMLFPAWRSGIGETFQTVADTLATGCLLALVRSRLTSSPRISAVQTHALAPFGWLIVALLGHLTHRYPSVSLPLGESINNIGVALFIDACLRQPKSLLGRVLDSRPLSYIGTLSYSLYLVQQPFINRTGSAWVNAFPQNLVCVAAGALASYYLIEKPFLDLRQRISRAWAKHSAARVSVSTGR
ncbi:MAG: acyltransferase [Polyangiaceae bacterium]